MIQRAWKIVANQMPESLRNWLGGARYIKYNGTPYHTEGVEEAIHRPEVKGALAITTALVAITLARQGSLDITSLKVLTTAAGGLLGGGFTYMGSRSLENLRKRFNSPLNKPIDTEGRDLSAVLPSLGTQIILNINNVQAKRFSLIWSVLFVSGSALYLSSESDLTQTFFYSSALSLAVSHIAKNASMAITSKKLLTSEYVFCDKPPTKQTSRASDTAKIPNAQTAQRQLAI